MGPILILDKSTFQSLGYEEHLELKKHFMENLTPILAMEIVADLAKEVKGKSSDDKLHRKLAPMLLRPNQSFIVGSE